MDKKKLIALLEDIAGGAEEHIVIPRTKKTKTISTSVKFWSQHRHLHPFITNWVSLANFAKLSQFFSGLQGEVIHPKYTTLVRTGRTSCSGPNVQQLPGAGGFREMVIASPGHYLLAIDYSAIELRTLAAVCEQRYSRSVLADVIRNGTDPHAYTAALFENLNLAEFMLLKETQPARFKTLRQRAKALNFGIPGGLGAASLVNYAAATYGVNMTLEEAETFRTKLVEEVFPELSKYLTEDGLAMLARNLKADVSLCRSCFRSVAGVRNVVRGRTRKRDGSPFNERWFAGVWDKLIALNRNRDLAESLEARKGSEELCRQVFWGPVVTLTGRIRGRVGFSQARNTPFQGLAADGAKLALWKLTKAGYRCVAFVHDEVLVELPIDADHAAEAKRIERIMCESMQEVTGTVPVACEYALCERWSKHAEAVFDSEGRLLLWRPSAERH